MCKNFCSIYFNYNESNINNYNFLKIVLYNIFNIKSSFQIFFIVMMA